MKKVDLYVFVFSPSCSTCGENDNHEKIKLRLENPKCDKNKWYVEEGKESKQNEVRIVYFKCM